MGPRLLSQAASLSFTDKRKSELLISVFENQLTYEHFFIDLNDDPYWNILIKKMEEIEPIIKKNLKFGLVPCISMLETLNYLMSLFLIL